jgi:predicted aspartyl protease
LEYHGPEIWVDIGFDPDYKPDKNAPPVPTISRVKALVDTGARQSCIDSSLASELGLPVFDRRRVSGVNGVIEVDFHLAQVHVPSLRFTLQGAFAGVPLIASGFRQRALVGRSFLSYVKMAYDGQTGEVVISV